jgi:hypothetical protein
MQHKLLCADQLHPIRKQLAALRMQTPSRRKAYDDLAQSPLYFVIGAERAANNVIRCDAALPFLPAPSSLRAAPTSSLARIAEG